MKPIYQLLALIAAAGSLGAAELKFDGWLGNSGTREKPVRFGSPALCDGHGNQVQAGPVFASESGRLYQSAGNGELNVYTLDGRMEKSWKIPRGYFDVSDAPLVRCGNALYFRRSGQIWSISLDAPDGATAVPSKFSVDPRNRRSSGVCQIAATARDGKLTVLRNNGELSEFDPVSGKNTVLGTLPESGATALDRGPDGTLWFVKGKQVRKIVNGKFAGDAKTVIGRGHPNLRGNFAGPGFFGCGWSGTVARFDGKTFDAAPGVVLGGRGGHFIGYVFCDGELRIPSGIAEIGPGLYAVGGSSGAIVLTRWNANTGKLERLRRIGALREPAGMAIDSQGRVAAGEYFWNWTDDGATPVRGDFRFEPAALARFGGDDVLAVGTQYRQFAVNANILNDELRSTLRTQAVKPLPTVAGAAIYGTFPYKQKMLVLGRNGDVLAGRLQYDRHRTTFTPEPVKLLPASPVAGWNGLDKLDDSTLVAITSDGKIVEFKQDGADWKESRRWSRSFAPGARIGADSGRVAVSEKSANRVLLWRAADEKELAQTAVPAPGAIALNGKYLAVYETDNQRVAKYLTTEEK